MATPRTTSSPPYLYVPPPKTMGFIAEIMEGVSSIGDTANTTMAWAADIIQGGPQKRRRDAAAARVEAGRQREHEMALARLGQRTAFEQAQAAQRFAQTKAQTSQKLLIIAGAMGISAIILFRLLASKKG